LPFISSIESSDTPDSIIPRSTEFQGSWKGKEVLVVEDTESNYQLIEQVLTQTGISIERASDGAAALDKYFEEGSSFDLIIMDIKLPGLDGYETIRKIRERDKTVPIISYTAYARDGDREKSMEAGCNAYFAKPTSSISLLIAISGLLDKKGD